MASKQDLANKRELSRLNKKMEKLEEGYKKIKIWRLKYFLIGTVVGMFLAGCIEYFFHRPESLGYKFLAYIFS